MGAAAAIDSVVVMRTSAVTHLVDGGKTAVLRGWTVPLEQDGRRVEPRGETVWKPVNRAGN